MVEGRQDELWDYVSIIRSDIQNVHRDPKKQPVKPESLRPRKKTQGGGTAERISFASFLNAVIKGR